jgi:hypothetical protein
MSYLFIVSSDEPRVIYLTSGRRAYHLATGTLFVYDDF